MDGGRSGSSQAAQVHEITRHATALRYTACISPAAVMPKRMVCSTPGAAKERAAKEAAKEELSRLSAKPAPGKVKTKPEKAPGKNKSADKKVQTKRKREAKGQQAEVADQKPEDLPAENGETNEESPASVQAGEKEATSD